MTINQALFEIELINSLSLEEVHQCYNVDTREEIISMIKEEIEEEVNISSDIYNENGFISAYACNSFLY